MTVSSLAHHFLIAYPTLDDAHFSRSVIYLYEHSSEGAMGLMVNKPLQMTLHDVLEHLDIECPHELVSSQPVMMGGPVGQEHGFVLFAEDMPAASDVEPGEEAEPTQDEVFLSSSKETLMMIANGAGPENYLVTLGYVGWGPGQLEAELHRNDWIVAPFDPALLFDVPIEQRWQQAALLIGIDVTRLSTQVGHA